MILALLTSSICSGGTCDRAVAAVEACNGAKDTTYIVPAYVLCLNGEIDSDGALRDKVRSFRYRKGLWIVATSPGGDVDKSIDIVETLEPYKYNVVVNGICASACAQFLFIGGNHKVVTGEGAVAVYGGPFTDMQITQLPLTDEQKTLARFTNNPKELLADLATGKIVFWVPKKSDFDAAGLRKLRYCSTKFMT